jgi:hypothetical protein
MSRYEMRSKIRKQQEVEQLIRNDEAAFKVLPFLFVLTLVLCIIKEAI